MTEPRPAPYPADTRAKGWRFELDVEQATQSSTWTLAREPQMRGLLLLLWITAWQQIPCGSLPDDDELLAAMVGMEPEQFSAKRRVLMRGWWRADDGRLYHDTIASRVRDMLGAKEKERQRKAEYRAKKDAERAGSPKNVPRDNQRTDAGLPSDSTVGDATGTGTGTGTGLIQEPDVVLPRPLRPPARDADVPRDTTGQGGTEAGRLCWRLRQSGFQRVNPAHPTLQALLTAGATVDEFMGFVPQCEGKDDPFAYLLKLVENQRKRAAKVAGEVHNGPLRTPNRQEAIEEQNRAAGERWLAAQGAPQ